MTWTECPKCHRFTYAYGEKCEHCGAALDGGILPLLGVGGGPLEHFICPKCAYVNKPESRVCEKCGETLPKSFDVRVEELKKAFKKTPETLKLTASWGNYIKRTIFSKTGDREGALEQCHCLSKCD